MASGYSSDYVAAPQTDHTINTLTRNSWHAQALIEQQATKHSPPSCWNFVLSFLSFVFCPFVGFMAVLFAFEARSSYITGRHEEAELYSSKSRGTACYAIAIGIGLGVGYGVLLGLGYRFGWF